MENQHRLIKGYRDLSAEEINLMNEIKQEGFALAILLLKAQIHLKHQATDALRGAEHEGDLTAEQDAEFLRIQQAEPTRWIAVAKTHFQEGMMALTRAVAQPGNF